MKERMFEGESSLLRSLRKLRQPEIKPEESERYLKSWRKRVLDVSLGSTGLLGLPVILVAASVNKILEPQEPAFYKTKRIGKGGQEINIVKIRSMKSVGVGETVFEEVDPTRINWFGRFLRRTGIDELPQVFNLLSGEMSLIGPRACPDWQIKIIEAALPEKEFADWKKKYESCSPGGSGLAQIMGHRDLFYRQRVRLDRFYATHANLGLDLYIIFASPFTLIRGRGFR